MSELIPDWQTKPISELISLHYGKSPKEIISEQGAFPIYGTGGITGSTNSFLIEGPSIILGRKGSINNPQFVNGKCWPIDTTYYTTHKNSVSPE